jgi:hypothetical protein
MKKTLLLLSLFFGLSAQADASVVLFNDFSDVSLLKLNASAQAVTTSDGTVLRITPAASNRSGSFFSQSTLRAETFSSYFQFRITNPGGSLFDSNNETGADGIVFVVQSVSSSLGGLGEGMGYKGINHSIGIEFDTWHNSTNHDPYPGSGISNHLGIDINGIVDHGVGSPYTIKVEPRFDNGEIWHSWIDYNGSQVQVRISQTNTRPQDAILTRDLDLVSILGQEDAYVGFTSGTGSDWGNHDILKWEYRDEYSPIAPVTTPEPSTMVLFLTGLLAFFKKRFV